MRPDAPRRRRQPFRQDIGGDVFDMTMQSVMTAFAMSTMLPRMVPSLNPQLQVPAATRSFSFTLTGPAAFGFDPPWISFAMMNDGPGDVHVWVNSQEAVEGMAPAAVRAGDSLDQDFRFAVVQALIFELANPGTPASLRVFGLEGAA